MVSKVCFENEREICRDGLEAAFKIWSNVVVPTFITQSPNLIKNGMGNSEKKLPSGITGVGS